MTYHLRQPPAIRALTCLAAAGLALSVVPAEAQTRAQTPQPTGGRLHLQTGPAAPAAAPQPVPTAAPQLAPRTLPPAAGFGVRARQPEPIRPGRAPLRLPPAPPMPPPDVVDPPIPPIVVVPERRRRVIIHYQPVWVSPYDAYYGVDPRYPDHVAAPQPLVPTAAVPPEPEPEPLTDRQYGDLLLHWDEPEQAIAAYQQHLAEHPDDTEVMRSLGLALIDAARLQEGVAMVAMAYERNPDLAHQPVYDDVYGLRDDLRRNLNRVSMYANRVHTASAWLTLAVLMQAEGRTRPAAAMIERAERAGLPEEVAGPMRAAVGRTHRQAAQRP